MQRSFLKFAINCIKKLTTVNNNNINTNCYINNCVKIFKIFHTFHKKKLIVLSQNGSFKSVWYFISHQVYKFAGFYFGWFKKTNRWCLIFIINIINFKISKALNNFIKHIKNMFYLWTIFMTLNYDPKLLLLILVIKDLKIHINYISNGISQVKLLWI